MSNIFEEKFLADTNLFVYLLDKDSEFHKLTARFFLACSRRKKTVYVAQQTLAEVISVMVKVYKLDKGTAITKAKRLVQRQIVQVITPLPTTYLNFFRCLKKVHGEDVFDAFLAATTLDNGINHIVTNNPRDFQGIKGLEVLGLGDISKLLDSKVGSEY